MTPPTPTNIVVVLVLLSLSLSLPLATGNRRTMSTETAAKINQAALVYDNEILNQQLPPFASFIFKRATWLSKNGETETEFLVRHAGITPVGKDAVPLAGRRRLSQQLYDDGEPKQQEQLADRQHVLDFGYGAGHMTRLLRRSLEIEHQVHGIEISRVQASRATTATLASGKDLAAGIAYATHLGFGKLPYRTNYFQRVLSQQVFSHCPDRAATFAEIFRVLQPGGQLVFQDVFLSRSNHAAVHIEPINTALGTNMGSITQYKKDLITAGFVDIGIESIHDLADKIDAQKHLTERTAAGLFKPSEPAQQHPGLSTLNIEEARIRYGDVAVANALAHNALGLAIVKVRKPLKE